MLTSPVSGFNAMVGQCDHLYTEALTDGQTPPPKVQKHYTFFLYQVVENKAVEQSSELQSSCENCNAIA